MKSILVSHVELVAGAGNRVGRVLADVDEEQIQPAVAVVVEEHGARRVPDVAEARGRGDVAETPLSVVLKEHVAAANGRDVEVRVPVVVDVGKRSGHADLARHRHSGRGRDVLELAAAGILPEAVGSDLVDEVDVLSAVAVDIGNRQAVAVVVVRRLVRLAGVVDDAVPECDTAFGDAVGELEIVEGRDGSRRLDLLVAKLQEPRRILQVRRHEADRLRSLGLPGERRRARPGSHEKHRRCGGAEERNGQREKQRPS